MEDTERSESPLSIDVGHTHDVSISSFEADVSFQSSVQVPASPSTQLIFENTERSESPLSIDVGHTHDVSISFFEGGVSFQSSAQISASSSTQLIFEDTAILVC